MACFRLPGESLSSGRSSSADIAKQHDVLDQACDQPSSVQLSSNQKNKWNRKYQIGNLNVLDYEWQVRAMISNCRSLPTILFKCIEFETFTISKKRKEGQRFPFP
jgi:hypothetical protein